MFAPHESENRRKPFNGAYFGQFVKIKKAVKSVPDHIFDHLHDHNLIAYRGVAQLVARDVWDVDAAGSNPVTPTNNPLKRLGFRGFFIPFQPFSLSIAIQILLGLEYNNQIK